MGVRIKTISNDIPGTSKKPEHNSHDYQANKLSADSRQVNKILELEWEALGKKLHKQVGGTSGQELERLHRQLKEKDEKLRQAEHKIAELKKQLTALQEKQRTHQQQPGGKQPGNKQFSQKRPAATPARDAHGYHHPGERRR